MPIRLLLEQGLLGLMVPALVIDEFERNRASVERSMTSSVVERFRLIRQDVALDGSDDAVESILANFVFEQWAHKLPLIGAVTTRNFQDIRDLLERGTRLTPSRTDQERVVARG
jgi:hypothetical protein